MSTHVIVIGGGLVGLSVARALRRSAPALEVTVLEKEGGVGRHQSGHNSGVLHAGLYYRPGSSKARLAVRGIRMMASFCAEHGIAHEICGKLVVATTADEEARLAALHERGIANGLRGLQWLGPEAAREIEPNISCVAALRVPEEGIVDYPAVSQALAADLAGCGAEVRTHAAVLALRRGAGAWRVETASGEVAGSFVVNCAGLHADRVAAMAGLSSVARIVPFRGEYFALAPDRQALVRHLVYPVPDPAFPFLGVHFTRMIGGGVECGPNAVLAFKREGYRKADASLRDLADAMFYPGLWRFLSRYPSMVARELHRSLSRYEFCRALQRLVPAVQPDDLRPGGAGVRAQAMLPDGRLVEDFLFAEGPGSLHVINAPSPAATASLAIGEEVAARVRVALAR